MPACSVSLDRRRDSSRSLTLELALGSSLDGLLDLVVGSTLLNAASQVDNGDVLGWDTHGHAGKLAVEVWDDLADGLGGTGAGWNDVGSSGTSTTPVLARWTVNGLLGGGVRVDGGHQTLDDGVLVVNDLGERSQAVGGARGVGDDLNVALVALLVDTHDEHWGISRWSRDDNLLGTTLQVGTGLVLFIIRIEPSFSKCDRICGRSTVEVRSYLGGENTGGLDCIVVSLEQTG